MPSDRAEGGTFRLSDVLAWALAIALTAAAVLKFSDPAMSWTTLANWVAVGELLAAAFVAYPRTRRLGAVAVACAFLGAGITRSLMMVLVPDLPACACLGAVEANHGSLLMIQGLVVAVAGWIGTAPVAADLHG